MSSNQQTSNIEPMENEMESRENMKEIEEMLSPDVLKYIEQMTEETKQDQLAGKVMTEEDHMLKMGKMYSEIQKIAGKEGKNNTINRLLGSTQKPYALKNCNIKVGKSNVHGNGVFATEDISKDTVITFFPIHCLIDKSDSNPAGEVPSYYATKNVFDVNTEENIFEINLSYKMDISNEYCAFGDPNKTSDPELLGHIINDSTSFKTNKSDAKSIKNEVCRYILSSNNNSVMTIYDEYGLFYVKATKDIKKGDEILMSYSMKYWFDQAQHNTFIEMCKTDENFKVFIANNMHKLF